MLRNHHVVDGEEITAKAFRIAMRRVASTVHILSVSSIEGPYGMTATAVNSLSFEPLSLVACVNQSASIHRQLLAADCFCVNVLSAEQDVIADQFGKRDLNAKRFSTGVWVDFRGTPALADAQSNILCQRRHLADVGTHSLFVGNVIEVRTRPVPPLVYQDGAYVS